MAPVFYFISEILPMGTIIFYHYTSFTAIQADEQKEMAR